MRDLLVLPKLGMKLGDLPIIIKEHTSLLHTDITSSHVAVHSQDGANREGNAFNIYINHIKMNFKVVRYNSPKRY